jgi:spore coat protein A, manganese oxidase
MFPRFSVALEMRKRFLVGFCALVGSSLVVLGVFAKKGWLPSTDPFTGAKTGWFGKQLSKNASSIWNPMAEPLPVPTPQLSKSYVYAGSRLIAVQDANASASPPYDLAVWRPSTGNWYVLGGAGSQQTTYGWGTSGDIPVPGDYDGDGKTDFSVFRPSTGVWWVTRSSDGIYYSTSYGSSGDVPAPADYDGDGKTDLSLWRPSTQVWYVTPSSTGTANNYSHGSSGDVPVPADYDGDGKADLGVWRSSNLTFYSINSSNGASVQTSHGSSGDDCIKVIDACLNSDYDGDGKADLAVWRSSNATWYVKQSLTGSTVSTQYGAAGDKLVPNDYDGDAKVDIAVWRPSTGVWWILQSATSSTRTETWGTSGDTPVPAFYRR